MPLLRTLPFFPVRPNLLPVIGTQILARNNAVSRALDSDAVLRVWTSAAVSMSPLADLGIALDLIAKALHPLAKLCDREGAIR